MNRISISYIANLFFLAISSLLMIRYANSAGDIDLYTQGGKKLLSGVNPYLDSEYANSPIAAVMVFWISLLIPASVFPALIQALNIIGVLSFSSFLLRFSRDHRTYLFTMVGISISSPLRALIADVQVTGIVLGLFTASMHLIAMNNRFLRFSAFLLVCVNIELKPQISLPLALIFWIKNWNRVLFSITAVFFSFLHLLLSVQYGGFVEYLWLDKLSRFSAKSLNPGPEISAWKFFNFLFQQELAIKIISSTLFAALFLAIVWKGKNQLPYLLLVATGAPLVNSYSHLYDLVPFLLLVGLNKRFQPEFKLILYIILIIPADIDAKLVFVAVLIGFIAMRFFSKWVGATIGVSAILYVLGILFLSHELASGDVELELSCRLVALVPYLFLRSKNFRIQ